MKPPDIRVRLERAFAGIAAGFQPALEERVGTVGVEVAGGLPGVEIEGHNGRILPLGDSLAGASLDLAATTPLGLAPAVTR